jgi:glutaredoxin|tara:strand:- start:807 stop:1034 length:228 start_codon:yes stop_codon:yes gene_type:complete
MSYVVIGTDNCGFCTKAKQLLKEKRVVFTDYSLNSPSSKWLLTLFKQSGMTTVPQIWDSKGHHIGGYNELKEHLE